MGIPHRKYRRVTAAAIHPGTRVRYHHRDGSSRARVTEKTARYVTFAGDDCDGTFTHEQIDRLLTDDRLHIVLDAADRYRLATDG